MIEDAELLRRYARTRSEAAFAELVRRHLNLVYSVALRQVRGDAHLADDVAQTVFTALARKAGSLSRGRVLAGWLYRTTQFTATDAVRSEQRRRKRELEAPTMQEATTTPIPVADWERLRPVLDEAISELTEADRDAVCLRFFEQCSFAEVGSRLRLTENAARMRVNRALDKLHGVLARRGITSTTAALAVALTGQASVAAPVGLAASLTSAALATGGLAAGATFLTLMSTSKITLGVAGLLAVAAGGIAWQQTNELHETRSRLAGTQAKEAELLDRVHALETHVENQTKSTQAAEEDVGRLLTAIEDVAARQSSQTDSTNLITHELVKNRYERAQELARNGQFEEALAEYIWCYDEGMVRIDSYRGVRSSFLLSKIADLGARFPEALEFLHQRRTAAEQQLLTTTTDRDAAKTLQSLNRTLHEEHQTLKFYDRLPADDPGKSYLGQLVYDQLLEAQRYTEAAAAKPFDRVLQSFERMITLRPTTTTRVSPAATAAQRRIAIKTAVEGVEVLAGAGNLLGASALAKSLLAYDNSSGTIALLQTHAARAGHPELVVLPTAQ